MNVYRASDVGDDWGEVRLELERIFQMSRTAAQGGESFVYVVRTDDLLGRRGAGNAMVATGLLSAARTAALEGWSKGWTVNVIAHNDDHDKVEAWADRLISAGDISGELIRLGTGHVGKALP